MEVDAYGTTFDEASRMLNQFLHETLGEPGARLVEVRLEDGRWQSRVLGSQRGISQVFLVEHNGQVVPGHMTRDAHMETMKKR